MTQPPLPADALRWHCDPSALGFATTAEVEPVEGIVGQPSAVEALRFGLEIDAPGQNVFVRGVAGTGRLTLVRRLLEEVEPEAPPAPDYAYVHNFECPDRPILLRLPRGRGEGFRDGMEELRIFIVEELPKALRSDLVDARRKELEQSHVEEINAITTPVEEELAKQELALMVAQDGQSAQPIILPLIEGQPAPPDRLAALKKDGHISDDDIEQMKTKAKGVEGQVAQTFKLVDGIQRKLRKELRALMETEATAVLQGAVAELREAYDEPAVQTYLDAVIHDIVHRRLGASENADFTRLYQVNLVVSHDPEARAPVIVENAPSMRTLLGSIDVARGPGGERRADHMSIHAGSLLRGDGGVVIVEAMELLQNPGAWRALVRTLRSGHVELIPPESAYAFAVPALKPEPAKVRVKVVLIGDNRLYYLLDQNDPDFPLLFKVLAEFDSELPSDAQSLSMYAQVISGLARQENLLAFSAGAVARLAEHGARIASHQGKLSARFGRLADLAREAAYLARKQEADGVTEVHVSEAISRTKRRADGPARRFREMIASGSIRIQTEGVQVGQINGLAVIAAGPLIYGFPTRITSTIAPGVGGVINIERESQLSGAIHTKAFYILGGLMRHLLQTDHALTFEASIAFEQSYGGIDGDSASGAEICCLISALTGIPVRQDLAMTGAIDQLGNILPIGAVTEKIEGFFDTCASQGLTGTQGVIIPQSNAIDLMLRPDIVQAAREGNFSVFAVTHIRQAIELFFGMEAGEYTENGIEPSTVLGHASKAARNLWERSATGPVRLLSDAVTTEEIILTTQSKE